MAGTNPVQPLLDEDPVVVIERHDIGNRAERDQVEKLGGQPGRALQALIL